jgi:Ran GTPase-activating protein (RanGAP) involved in mRNA processing and transport
VADNALGPAFSAMMGNAALDGITAITDAIVRCRTLRVLDLSSNDLSDQSQHRMLPTGARRTRGGRNLARVIGDTALKDSIEELNVSDARLGDRVCKELIEALKGSRSLRCLDLSDNGLGMASPEGQTGHGSAAAVSQMLEEKTCVLQVLRMGYNLLSAKHAERISTVLETNRSLTELDLSWNSLGDVGVMVISDSLRANKALQLLNLTKVEMLERGTMVVADMLKENSTLKTVILNENNIGQRGGRAIMRAMRKLVQYRWERDVQIFGCNYDFLTQEELYDPGEPEGKWECNLSDPYQVCVTPPSPPAENCGSPMFALALW